MMEPTEDRDRDDAADFLCTSRVGRVFVQQQMGSHLVVVSGVGLENPTQVRLA